MNATPHEALSTLAQRLDGEVRADRVHRQLYATDASIYSELPVGVAFPKTEADVLALVDYARKTSTPLIARTAGTSLAGQVVGSGLVVDFGRHMTAILDLDESAREVRVEPGVIQDDLNRFLSPSGLLFGPDTSTGSRAMIGGMIGNNSCGSRSVRYRTTREHIHRATAILADGSVAQLEPWSAADVDERIGRDDTVGRILAGLREIVADNRGLIAQRFPKASVTRRNTGYALDYLAETVLIDPEGEPLNLAKFLCGSEGTLALITESTFGCEPTPGARGLMVAQFDTVRKSLEATVRAVAYDPSAVELVDKPLLDLTIDQLEHRKNRFFLEGDPAAILMIEFFEDTQQEVDAKIAQVIADLGVDGLSYHCAHIPNERAERVWALRKAGLGLLMGIPGDAKPVAFVEDTAVAVRDLPDYIDEYRRIMTAYDVDCVYYGHASVGELHLRPRLSLKESAAVEKMKGIAHEVAELVAKYQGSLSGEHGDGRVRSPFLGVVMGAEVVELFRRVKALWDPDNLFNPGKIVDPVPVESDLRTRVDVETPTLDTHFAFAHDGGIVRHIERCNGAGACRKLDGAGGVMCPSYMATREELHTTRGRANLMRTLLTSDSPQTALASEDLFEAMSLCLMCKGCKIECPASVDMAQAKSEFLQHYWDAHGTPLKVRLVGHFATMGRLASIAPWLANWLMGNRLTAPLFKRLTGVQPGRALPRFSSPTLKRWFKRRGPITIADPVRQVAVFADEFTDLQDAENGRAAIELLEALGYQVDIPKHVDSGRPLISKGLLRAARKRAEKNVRALLPIAREGRPILGLEPSAALTLIDEYPELVRPEMRDAAKEVAAAVMLLEDFLASEHETRDLSSHFDDEARTIVFHGHCHQKALVGAEGAVAALRIPTNHEVSLIDAGCCGMAGSFGYEHVELSLKIGESRLFPAIRAAEDGAVIVAEGFSCRHQIADGTARRAVHPAVVLRDALKGDLQRRA